MASEKSLQEKLAEIEKILKDRGKPNPAIKLIPKKFMYCELTDGGMNYWTIENASGLVTEFPLSGWMSEEHGCRESDSDLIVWANTKAEIGDYFEHRMGVCIRIKP